MKAFIITTCLFLFSCTNHAEQIASANQIEENPIHMIVYHHVDRMIFTFTDVLCEEFERVFAKEKTRDTITDSTEIALFKRGMDSIYKVDISWRSIDTRAKMYFISTTDTIEYCIVNDIVQINTDFYKMPQWLYTHLEKYKKE